jgi:allantoin racemase
VRNILIINPARTERFNKFTMDYLKDKKLKENRICAVNAEGGPNSIETFEDEIKSGPFVLKLVEDNKNKYDAIIINCFADPVINAAREICHIPIIGPAQASMVVAMSLARKFAIISIYKKSGPWGELQARQARTENMLVYSTGIEIPVLELEKDPDRTKKEIIKEARFAIEKKGAEVIILGCTGMAPIARAIKEELGVPVIEPMLAALKTAEMLLEI